MAYSKPKDFSQMEFETNVVEFEWTIMDFKKNRAELAETVVSPTFPHSKLPQWSIELHPRGRKDQNTIFAALLILSKGKTGDSVTVDYKLSFLNDQRQAIIQAAENNRDFKLRAGFGLTRSALPTMNPAAVIPTSESGHLVMHVRITMTGGPIITTYYHNNVETPESKLESDWRSFFKSGQLSDFIIESADGQEFPTHKAVLACRSPSYFGKMLQSGMAESVNNRLKVEFSAEVVTALLEYFYSDSVSDLSTIAAKTIPAAHHYQLDRLMTMCKSELVKNLNCENISVALRLAKLYELDQLQSACEMFAGENKTELVKKFCLMAAEMDVENF